MTIDEQIEILQYYKEGGKVVWTWIIRKSSDTWEPITNGKFNFADKLYKKGDK